ncbi:MAG TPA: hypothetical protein DEO84_00375, partial [candidate division Zixibacteria bacterium]|nr:hypothetical protein [candidate division Zixibacteria bacterium]
MNLPNSNYATIALMFCFLTASGCSDKSTSNKIPNAPSGLTGQAISASSITLNWTDNSDNETSFLIYRKNDGAWTQASALAANVQSFTDSLLNDSTSYYYRVNAKNDAGESSPSDSISLCTFGIGHAPNIPFNPSPSNDSTSVPLYLNLGWTCSDPDGDSLTYDLYLGTGSYLNLLITDISINTFYIDTLEYYTRYNWKVIAKDGHRHATSSPVWQFTTRYNLAPVTPHGPTPSDGETGVAIDGGFVWLCTDPDNDYLTYDFYFGQTVPLPRVAYGLSLPVFGPGRLAYSTTYFWKIVAFDDYGNQTSGPVWNFVTRDSAYSLTVLL